VKRQVGGDPNEVSREIRNAIELIHAPRAPATIIDRVVAERARGVRARLPSGDPVRGPRLAGPAALGLAAAILVVAALMLNQRPAADGLAGDDLALTGECTMNGNGRTTLVFSSLLLAAACAQEPAQPLAPAPPVTTSEDRALGEGTWVYEVTRAGSPMWRETYELARLEVEWRSVSTRSFPGGRINDTVYYSTDGLRPLRQVTYFARGSKLDQVADLVFGPGRPTTAERAAPGASGAFGRRGPFGPEGPLGRNGPFKSITGFRGLEPLRLHVDLRVAGDPLVVPAYHAPALMHLVRLLPLEMGWTGSVKVGPFGATGIREETLRVVGDETIRVPAGEFPSWRIEAVMEKGAPQTLWVTKEQQLLVRGRFGPEGYVWESVLVSFVPGRE